MGDCEVRAEGVCEPKFRLYSDVIRNRIRRVEFKVGGEL